MNPRTKTTDIANRRFGSGTNDATIIATTIPDTHGAPIFADAAYHPNRERPVAWEAKWA